MAGRAAENSVSTGRPETKTNRLDRTALAPTPCFAGTVSRAPPSLGRTVTRLIETRLQELCPPRNSEGQPPCCPRQRTRQSSSLRLPHRNKDICCLHQERLLDPVVRQNRLLLDESKSRTRERRFSYGSIFKVIRLKSHRRLLLVIAEFGAEEQHYENAGCAWNDNVVQQLFGAGLRFHF